MKCVPQMGFIPNSISIGKEERGNFVRGPVRSNPIQSNPLEIKPHVAEYIRRQ